MKYIFGLGNPGKRFEKTRHNAGFEVVDILAHRHGMHLKEKAKLESKIADGFIDGVRVMLVEPQTYMNESGYAASAVLDYYRAEPAEIIVIYDDIDIPFGTLRIRERGSAGTHNGMRSVIGYIQSEEFVRVRVGIGKPEDRQPLKDFVLSRFRDQEASAELFGRAADAVETILTRGVQQAQQEYQEKRQ